MLTNFDGFDTPGFGADSEAVYLTTNIYRGTSGPPTTPFGSFDYLALDIMCKAYLMTGDTSNCGTIGSSNIEFSGLTNDGTHKTFSLMPALEYGAPHAEFLINTDWDPNTNQPSGNTYNIWALTNPLEQGGTTVRLSGVGIGNLNWAAPHAATDPDGDTINDGWPFMTNLPVYRDGALYASVTSGVNNGAIANAPGVLWFSFGLGLNNGVSGNPRGDLLRNAYGRENGAILFSGTGGAYYPSQAVDGDGDICFTFNYSSSTVFPSVTTTCRRPTTPRGASSNSYYTVIGVGPLNTANLGWGKLFGDNPATAWDPSGQSADNGSSCFVSLGE
jgi:hypothetical protein